MKKIKKGFGLLLVIFESLLCVASCYCFFAAVAGKLESGTFGETLASAIFFAVLAVISASAARFGWRLWKGKKDSDLQKREIKPLMNDGELLENEGMKSEKLEFGNEQRKKLKPFLVEDRKPFAAYDLERIYYERIQNCTDVEQFYYVPNEAPVQLAIRKYQAYLEWRKEWRKTHQIFSEWGKEHSTGKDSASKKIHIRVSSEKSLAGCDNFYYEQCLKAGMHIVMYTGPYTLLDVTEGREYKVIVKTVNDNIQAGEITGTWSLG